MINFLDGNTTFISPIFIGQETVCYNEMEVQLEAEGVTIYRTDQRGAIRLRGRKSWRLETVR